MKTRLDRLMVERGLAESPRKGARLIMAGEVRVAGQKASKPGQQVVDDAPVEVLARPPYVGRGGFKLAAALRQFPIDAAGKVCLDIGASTGGFTDALLQAGAARVHAVDVGSGQLDWKLRSDARVVVHERDQRARAHIPGDRRAGGSGRLRCELHFGDPDPARRGAAAAPGRANGYTGQTAV